MEKFYKCVAAFSPCTPAVEELSEESGGILAKMHTIVNWKEGPSVGITTLLCHNSQRRLEHKENQAKFKKKNDQEASEPLGVMLEFYYIERGLLANCEG